MFSAIAFELIFECEEMFSAIAFELNLRTCIKYIFDMDSTLGRGVRHVRSGAERG